MGMKAKLGLRRFDKNMNLLESREQPFRSWTLRFIQILYVMSAEISTGAPYNVPDITNTNRGLDAQKNGNAAQRWNKDNMVIAGPAGGSATYMFHGNELSVNQIKPALRVPGYNLGIVVGSDNTAAAPTQFALGTQIAHGEAAGELLYGGNECITIAFVNPNGQFTVRRYFTNVSGGDVTIEEVGIYANGASQTIPAIYQFCIARDVVAPAEVVADTEILEVTYTVQITV